MGVKEPQRSKEADGVKRPTEVKGSTEVLGGVFGWIFGGLLRYAPALTRLVMRQYQPCI